MAVEETVRCRGGEVREAVAVEIDRREDLAEVIRVGVREDADVLVRNADRQVGAAVAVEVSGRERLAEVVLCFGRAYDVRDRFPVALDLPSVALAPRPCGFPRQVRACAGPCILLPRGRTEFVGPRIHPETGAHHDP
jgi:hypothetical protein